jgi:hypothetical protein
VHAGLVNAALAEAIAARESGEATRIVLTGDLANEFLADYGPEQYGGTTYYELPRLRGPALRDALVRGLDSSNREIGVFSAWGLAVVQPYAVAVDSYLALPSEIVGLPEGKRLLSEAIFGSLLPGYVYSRPKVRAQVGSSSGDSGILALCAERGVDSAYLRERFAFLHHAAEAALARFIRGGTYRSSAPTLRLGEAT